VAAGAYATIFAMKADANRRKHGIGFEIAAQVFADGLCKQEFESNEHGEDRWRTTGQIGKTLLVVSHTKREKGGVEVVRIISARKATPSERRDFEENP
jgi:uncharacterized DUF497 family protein